MTCLATEQDIVARMTGVLVQAHAPLDDSLCSRLTARSHLLRAGFSQPAIEMNFEAARERARMMFGGQGGLG
jgi:hypothetical protein